MNQAKEIDTRQRYLGVDGWRVSVVSENNNLIILSVKGGFPNSSTVKEKRRRRLTASA